jgi:hypothetical protein
MRLIFHGFANKPAALKIPKISFEPLQVPSRPTVARTKSGGAAAEILLGAKKWASVRRDIL